MYCTLTCGAKLIWRAENFLTHLPTKNSDAKQQTRAEKGPRAFQRRAPPHSQPNDIYDEGRGSS